jgi:hypothetical protein
MAFSKGDFFRPPARRLQRPKLQHADMPAAIGAGHIEVDDDRLIGQMVFHPRSQRQITDGRGFRFTNYGAAHAKEPHLPWKPGPSLWPAVDGYKSGWCRYVKNKRLWSRRLEDYLLCARPSPHLVSSFPF